MSNTKNLSVIYCTANLEDDKLENKIRKQIRENSGDLPIISVSRKPIKFGKNICVGKVPICDSSLLKMLLKGLEKANTEYAVATEANCLYPPEYFSFIPPKDNIVYRYGNVWTLGDRFWRKKYLDGAQVCNRKFWISSIKEALKKQKGWEKLDTQPVFEVIDYLSWNSENAVVRLITPNTSKKYSNLFRGLKPKSDLPYWGIANDLKKEWGA